jgi:hypothetical protein
MTAAKWLVAIAMVSIGLAAPRIASADDLVTVSISNVSFSGNSVCGPSGTALCTETISASYEWDNTTDSYVTGSFASTESGALGSSFTLAFPPQERAAWAVEFDVDGGGSTIFFDLVNTSGLTTGTYAAVGDAFFVPPGNYSGDLECGSTPCSTDFPVVGPYGDGGAFASGGTVTVSPAVAGVAPEPSTILLMGTSLLAVAAVRRKRLA